MEVEKYKAMEMMKKNFEKERNKLVEETKKKQWVRSKPVTFRSDQQFE